MLPYHVLFFQKNIRPQKVAEIQECWRRRYASFLHLQLHELSDINPHHQEHKLLARREIPLGALLCGTDLATCYRGPAALYYHSPNSVQTWPSFPCLNISTSICGHYSWNPIDLLTHRLEGLVFPSVLLAPKSFRLYRRPSLDTEVNIVLHFLGNGLSCGEAIRTINKGEELVRHWDLGEYQWRHTERAGWWCNESGAYQARTLYALQKPSNGYYLDCLKHDADDTRPDRIKWYHDATFEAQALLVEACEADIVEMQRRSRKRDRDSLEASERLLMQSYDVNVLLIV